MTRHVVMFSGGLGSWATAKLVAERFGTEHLVLLFSDVQGDSPEPHVGEDEDTYRFIEEAARNVGGTLVVVKDGRNIWEVFKDRKFLGNARQANCSTELKQKPARQWLEANCDPENTIVYVGIDWSEEHRLPPVVKNYLPWRAEAPLTDPPYYDKEQIKEWAASEGLEIPRLYGQGFVHNNCGGGCVRAGQGQFAMLLQQNPERFAVWEQKEQEIREHLDKDVSILRDRRGGTSKPLTLRAFRERHEAKPEQTDLLDIGGCGCFLDTDEGKS